MARLERPKSVTLNLGNGHKPPSRTLSHTPQQCCTKWCQRQLLEISQPGTTLQMKSVGLSFFPLRFFDEGQEAAFVKILLRRQRIRIALSGIFGEALAQWSVSKCRKNFSLCLIFCCLDTRFGNQVNCCDPFRICTRQ